MTSLYAIFSVAMVSPYILKRSLSMQIQLLHCLHIFCIPGFLWREFLSLLQNGLRFLQQYPPLQKYSRHIIHISVI